MVMRLSWGKVVKAAPNAKAFQVVWLFKNPPGSKPPLADTEVTDCAPKVTRSVPSNSMAPKG